MSNWETAVTAMLADITPKKLLTNEEVFGKGAEMGDAKAMGFTDMLDAMTPKKMPTNEELFGQMAEIDTTHIMPLLDMITPKKLMTYDDLGALIGLKF
ncbi:MAG: hypothetical protein V7668_19650 [Cereibacter changlensis]|uniref:Uncharacterized protein n=2 Tax=Cereibacter changlensis TaxID=402884 RepID=A0A2T4JSN4_9RHOB|nr:hypothetical protein [Cereibacter changlensis]PTE20886.1 hypothetical protein C5F48_15165 [Cereibacter changlensis JA139]PZX53606.1 hypothetical protein LX76_02244 [Cereibacter changlensis]